MDEDFSGLVIVAVVIFIVTILGVITANILAGVFFPSGNGVCTETVTSLGLPDMMVQQGRDYERSVAVGTKVDIDSCSSATKTGKGKWEVVIGDC